MLVSDLLERLGAGENIKGICKEIGVDPSTIQRRLKRLGYAWDNSSKVWYWTVEGEEQPLSVDLLGDVKSRVISSNTKSNTKSPKYDHVLPTSYEYEDVLPLTAKEIATIREMIAQWDSTLSPVAVAKEVDTLSIYERVQAIEPTDKTRKTFVISKPLAHDLDTFANDKKVNLSDILHLALMDFLNKYN